MAQQARIVPALHGVGLIQRGGRGRPTSCPVLLLPMLLIHLLLLLLAPAAVADSKTHALLINGGSKPASNYQSHLHHLQDMVDILEMRGVTREQIHIFSADGEDESADLAVRDSPRARFWLVEKTRLGRLRMPVTLTDAIACSAQNDQLAL